ncbi:MAG: Iron-sulfur cluster repair protein YtfE [Acidimicrobiales bacterium]|nr:MAG: iron-sulfur cluster repair di-iron protein [Actinomycetota bacterium]MBV6506982.1 Iron-sulfur cluster repair protein YtfE [Acidimicrobiales bacterium]RIK05794.1 MAG: iron-sulfur cluster repair di-iron protein [Acidobacteriota bacterium]
MSTLDPDTVVSSLVTERPSRATVLDALGIDYCCNGHRTVVQACASAGIGVAELRDALQNHDASSDEADTEVSAAWATMRIGELTDHIEGVHHTYTHETMPRLGSLADKVVGVHGDRHPELSEIQGAYQALRSELESHLMKEERVLFPMCRELDSAEGTPEFHCGTLQNPIRVMGQEHDVAGELLARLRRLSSDYTPPDDACESYRALYAGLEELEADLHLHIHKESNVLFPAVLAREAELADATG